MAKAVPAAYVRNYDHALTRLTERACAELRPLLLRIDYSDVAAARDAAIAALDAYMAAYTEAAASLSAAFYKECRDRVLGGDYEPTVESGREPEATAESVRAFIQTIVDGNAPEAFVAKVLERVSYEMRKAASDCMLANARYDPY